jgi:hypothetical protein
MVFAALLPGKRLSMLGRWQWDGVWFSSNDAKVGREIACVVW